MTDETAITAHGAGAVTEALKTELERQAGVLRNRIQQIRIDHPEAADSRRDELAAVEEKIEALRALRPDEAAGQGDADGALLDQAVAFAEMWGTEQNWQHVRDAYVAAILRDRAALSRPPLRKTMPNYPRYDNARST